MIHGPTTTEPTVTDLRSPNVLASYLAVLAIPAGLWTLANPLAGGGAIAAYWGTRRLLAVGKRLARRRTVSIRVGEALRITATRVRPDEPGPAERCCA